jgi:hypothetical protein
MLWSKVGLLAVSSPQYTNTAISDPRQKPKSVNLVGIHFAQI